MRLLPPIGRLAALTLLTAACGRVAPVTDADLDRLPDYQHARKATDAGDFRSAAVFYEKVVRAAPDAGQAHLELGLLYDKELGDPIAALYHYRQFLALKPDSERRAVVESFIERAKLSLAAKLPTAPAADNTSELVRLQNENAALRAHVAELEKPAPVAPPPSEPATPPASPRTHVVQKGDTLQSLALRYYGTRSAWEKIYTANQTILPSKDQLKVGQQLVIP